jgi:hypothetical protein
MQRRACRRSPSKARTGDIDMFAIDKRSARNHRYAFVAADFDHGRKFGSGYASVEGRIFGSAR